MLNLPADLPAHFIGEKAVRRGDVSAYEHRFFLPGGNDGGSVLRRLLDILTPEELSSVEPEDETTGEGKRKRMETTGAQAQCGLPVKLVNHRAGAVESRLLRLRSSDDAVVRRCGLKEDDVVEIWALQGHLDFFRLF